MIVNPDLNPGHNEGTVTKIEGEFNLGTTKSITFHMSGSVFMLDSALSDANYLYAYILIVKAFYNKKKISVNVDDSTGLNIVNKITVSNDS
ncbi:hypothetical protein [Photorhabdus caribbeanensis]|uniref:hypothetical protein n=1 Tax=Photorhabdus caribbeanensis TaxID=1004165 RepID=UPI001BD312CF|nr:hypothetical protein [Photorhabdus caribbeanensis]MBS9422598.1 hypothetical protein [Photorhabdus caribbeanensis]